jgi:hypothetical protein
MNLENLTRVSTLFCSFLRPMCEARKTGGLEVTHGCSASSESSLSRADLLMVCLRRCVRFQCSLDRLTLRACRHARSSPWITAASSPIAIGGMDGIQSSAIAKAVDCEQASGGPRTDGQPRPSCRQGASAFVIQIARRRRHRGFRRHHRLPAFPATRR